MRRIVLKEKEEPKPIELEVTENTICSFCFEKKKQCIKSIEWFNEKSVIYDFKVKHFVCPDDIKTGWFGTHKTKNIYKESFIDRVNVKENKQHAHICTDCIKQLAELIK